MNTLQSILLGTAGLSFLALVGLGLAWHRGTVAAEHVPPVWRLLGFAIAIQVVHVAEEAVTGFHRSFPELLGLPPWPLSFFVLFNGSWLVLWAISSRFLDTHRLAVAATWFLALGSAANGIAHPLFALAVDGYFPGLGSSPIAGVLGYLLLRRLARSTAPQPRRSGAR